MSIASLTAVDNAAPRRIALVHDWLTTYVGGERVLEQMIDLYPQGQVFTSIDVLAEHERGFLQGRRPVTSFAQHWPLMRRYYRHFLPLLMLAIEQLDVRDADLVLSSSASIGKAVLTGPDQLHISYVHSPMRYAWDLQHEYLRDANMTRGMRSLLARWMLHKARLWDSRTANGVDHFIANSHFIARRIWKTYRRESTVIHPPVDVAGFALRETKEEFYLTASRLVPYKKVPQIVAAFQALPGRRLVVVGDGGDMRRTKALAGPNVEILGYQPTAVLRDLMQRAKGFVFAAEEDFGIAPVEAQACGTPVIAYGRGGALETVRGAGHPEPTGIFFDSQTPAAIAGAIEEFEACGQRITARACRNNAQRFAIDVFRERYARFVQGCWEEFRPGADSAKKTTRRLVRQESGVSGASVGF
jgi:glycosyltransferase involved in cell wall biosynthesis